MQSVSMINPLANRLKAVSALVLLCALMAAPRVAGAAAASDVFLPGSFTSLGSNPFTNAGTCTINSSGSNPVLTLPDSSTITGEVTFGVAVFTFDSISIPSNVTVVGLQNANSQPVALLSHGDVTIGGIVDVSGANGKNQAAPNGNTGGAGGAAGPGGGGGGGGGGSIIVGAPVIANPTAVRPAGNGAGFEGGVGGAGLVNGSNGNPGAPGVEATGGAGGAGGAVDSNGSGTGGTENNAGGGGAFGGNGGNAIYNESAGGTAYGDLSIVLQGGSGGGGGGGIGVPYDGGGAAGGGGGGGAVEIGAVNQITITGSVLANGGSGGSDFRNGGGGAGGGILINGDAVSFWGAGALSAAGGAGPVYSGGGGGGRISILATTAITTESTDLTTRVNLAGGSASSDGNPGSNGVLVTSGTICPTLRVVLNANDSGPGSLRQAILDAGSCPGTNTITFAPSAYGTITLTSGELVVSSDLNIYGPGATNVTVNGNYPNVTNRVFAIDGSLTVTIAGLTVSNGFDNSNLTPEGGGIFNPQGNLTVSNCTVVGNMLGSSAPESDGGGIYDQGTLTLVNCIVTGNSFTGHGFGGGIYVDVSGNLTVLNSTICSNAAGSSGSGGGIHNNGGTVEILNSSVVGNHADFDGGGIGNDSGGSATVLNSTINGNSAELGGGIYNADALSGTTSTVTIGSTILENTASVGDPNIETAGNGGTAITISLGYNMVTDNGSGALTNSTDLTNTNAMLGPLQDNGGPTPTCALLCGSPAIDQGTNFSGSATDQRGLPRTVITPSITKPPGGDGTDIGAFEVQINCYPQPVAVCSNVTVSAGSNCTAAASVDGGSYDPNPSNSITVVQSPPSPYDLGSNSVTLSVFDQYNNTNTCQATVLVLDMTPPVPLVPALPAISNQCSATLTAPQAFDNCAGTITASTADPTSYSSQGSFLVHWVYNDGNGNTATQLQSVVVKDTTPPMITCPSDITSNTAPGECGATITWAAPEATDNCGTVNVSCSPSSGTLFSQGATKVTCTATDAAGNSTNCSFNVTVNQSAVCGITASGSADGLTICQGSTVILTAANGMKSYLWTGPEQNGATVRTIVVGTAGTYYCTQAQYYGSTNCCSVTVVVNPPPNATISGNPVITNGLPTTLVGPSGLAGEYWTGPQNNGLASRSNTVIDPGIYTLHVTDTNGCQNTGSVTVLNQTPAPCSITASGDSGDLVICQGGSTILTGANGMSSYLWNGPEQSGATAKSIRVGTQGTYTVRQIDGNGLTNTCSVFLTVHPMPSVNISGNRTFCQGTNTTLYGPSGMSQYLWLGPQHNGFEGQSNTVSLAGTYTLTVTDSNGCQNAISVPVTVINCHF